LSTRATEPNATDSPTHALKTNARLSDKQAVEIYALKAIAKISSSEVARRFHITEKAVRDIWCGKTWIRETSVLLDPAEAAFKFSQLRPPGRPKGIGTYQTALSSQKLLADHIPPWKTTSKAHGPNLASFSAESLSSCSRQESKSVAPEQNFSANIPFIDSFHDDWPFWSPSGDDVNRATTFIGMFTLVDNAEDSAQFTLPPRLISSDFRP